MKIEALWLDFSNLNLANTSEHVSCLKVSRKTSSRRLGRGKISTLKTTSRRFQDVLEGNKLFTRTSVSHKSKCISNKSISDESKVNQKCIN